MQGRGSGGCASSPSTARRPGETDEFGLPVRYNWAAEYRGAAHVVYGHTPVPEAEWLNSTHQHRHRLRLRRQAHGPALARSGNWSPLPAPRTYAEPARPFLPEPTAGPGALRPAATRRPAGYRRRARASGSSPRGCTHNVTIREENAIAALEVMSRFAADPKWLIYLPPTMSPTETTDRARPAGAPAARRSPTTAARASAGSSARRSTWARGRWSSSAATRRPRGERFGVAADGTGIVYTRTGRRFFDDRAIEAELLDRCAQALTAAGFWDEFASDWVCLDCELMPWSAKAQDLLQPPVRRRRRGGAGRAGRRRSPALRAGRRAIRRRIGRRTRPTTARAPARPAESAWTTTSTPTAATAGRCTRSTT